MDDVDLVKLFITMEEIFFISQLNQRRQREYETPLKMSTAW